MIEAWDKLQKEEGGCECVCTPCMNEWLDEKRLVYALISERESLLSRVESARKALLEIKEWTDGNDVEETVTRQFERDRVVHEHQIKEVLKILE